MKKTLWPKLSEIRASWYVWIFPLIALVISGWLVFRYFSEQGPRIKIYFSDASGVQQEKTTVRFRGISIGTVKDVHISEDGHSAVAVVLLRRDAKRFASAGSRYSLVTPKVNFQGVSGLETIFEGTYISVIPGPDGAKKQLEFQAENAGPTEPLDNTSAYLLQTDNIESVKQGDPVSYRGLDIGTVTRLSLNKTGQQIQIQINIENKYAGLIRANTVFWRKVGVKAKLGLFGSELKVHSLGSIMNGGIELATPDKAGPPAKAFQKFELARVVPKDYEKWNPVLE